MQSILVVDDEPAVRDVLASVLVDAGYAVHTAADGLAALEALAPLAPDLVITDLYMPRLDGTGLIARLQRERPDLPVLVVSAALRVSPPHGVHVITKPFDAEQLLATVAQLLAA